MSTEADRGHEKEVPSHSTLGRGHLSHGKWYCECDRPAKLITTKKNSPNNGRKMWRCAKVYDKQCAFFLWLEHEAAAKDWLSASQLPPAPQTPKKAGANGNGPDSLPQLLETPFTKAKRKEVSRDTTNYDKHDDSLSRDANAIDNPLQPVMAINLRQPQEGMRKAARTSTISTPSRLFIERLQSSPPPLLTPNSRDRITPTNTMVSQPRLLQQRDTSPTPGRSGNIAGLNSIAEPDLITRVIELIRADHPELKASTEMQLRHEIGLTLDVDETKLRRYEGTISEQRKRVDELETMILHLN